MMANLIIEPSDKLIRDLQAGRFYIKKTDGSTIELHDLSLKPMATTSSRSGLINPGILNLVAGILAATCGLQAVTDRSKPDEVIFRSP